MTNSEKQFAKEFHKLMQKYSISRVNVEFIQMPNYNINAITFWSNGRNFIFEEYADGKLHNVISEICEADSTVE